MITLTALALSSETILLKNLAYENPDAFYGNLPYRSIMADNLEILQQQRLIEIGKYLRYVRRERKADLKELSERTRISLQYLEAIEAGNLKQLPEAVDIRSLIKQYGDALKLSGQKLAMTFPLELKWAELE